MAEGLLSGVRILDAATLAAGPLAATYLAEFGAEVIKVEQPQVGDPIREWGTQRDGVGLMWKSVGRNKKSITLDLRRSEGQDLFRRLATFADVVVVNTRPSTLQRWRLDYPQLRRVNSELIMLHVTGYGLGGPDSDRPGFGTLGEAMSGFAHLTGEADRAPTLPRFMLADGVAALTGANAVMMALYHRERNGGGGQLIDVNLIDPLARLLEHAVLDYDETGVVPSRAGNRWGISVPRNTYMTKDEQWIAVSASTSSVALRVFRAIGRSDLSELYPDAQTRLAHADEIDRIVADWVASQTLDSALETFQREQVAAAPVFDVKQLLADEHLKLRKLHVRVSDPQVGVMRVQAPVPRFSRNPGGIRHLGPSLGEHNDEIYRGLLHLTAEELDHLRETQLI